MTKLITIPRIKLLINLFIAVIIIMGIFTIGGKTNKLISSPDEINIVKLDVPWCHPVNNVAILFDQHALSSNPDLYNKMQIKIYTYDLIKRFVYISLLVLILILLKRLIISINTKTFFDLKNILIIKHLAIVVGSWVICGFIFYQLIPVFISVDLMVETVNFSTMSESVIGNVLVAIDFKMLFVAIILYVISVSFKEGYQLKEQTDLTI